MDQDEQQAVNEGVEIATATVVGVVKNIAENPSFSQNLAKISRNYFDALVNEGFTHSEALTIVSNFKLSK